jgi:phosphoenolpyruvate synthase/pyruvate phosphate dikinase
MRPFFLSLKAIKKKDKAIVGSKAFRLYQLLKRNLPVPRAFVLTTHAFDLFLTKTTFFIY